MRRIGCLLLLLFILQAPFFYALWESHSLQEYISKLAVSPAEIPFDDYRGGIHVHSVQGGHSLVHYPEMIEAARQARYRFLFVTEHPRTPLHLPVSDPDLLTIYGEELDQDGLHWIQDPQGKLRILTHIAGSLQPEGFQGVELYNIHENGQSADNWFQRVNFLYQKPFFPELFFFHGWRIQLDRIAEWDRELLKGRIVGVAGNDAHQNIGLVLQTASGQRLWDVYIDPYLSSLRFVTTHVVLRKDETLSQQTLLEALARGQAYIAFEQIADPTGFSFHAMTSNGAEPMGSEVASGSTLVIQTPTSSRIRLIRNGQTLVEQEGQYLTMDDLQAGVYRCEVYLLQPPALVEGKPWIIANPIFVREN